MQKRVLTINGVERTFIANPDKTLASVLREQFLLTGCKVGCGTGQCGACSVIMNGKVIRSCITKMNRVPEPGAADTAIESPVPKRTAVFDEI